MTWQKDLSRATGQNDPVLYFDSKELESHASSSDTLGLQLDPLVLSHSWDIVPSPLIKVPCDFISSDLLCAGPS